MDAAFDASGHLFELLEGPQVIFLYEYRDKVNCDS